MKIYSVLAGAGDGRAYLTWFTDEQTAQLVLDNPSMSDGLIPTFGPMLTIPSGVTPTMLGMTDVCTLNPMAYVQSLGYSSLKEYATSMQNGLGF